MWLVIGLGNPGSKYLLTRHNIGFMALDAYLKSVGSPPEKSEKKSLTYHFKIDDQKIIFAKPQTYMNLSGDSVQELSKFYEIPPEKMIIVHDEVDQPFGQMKIQKARGHGGHNGIRDIQDKLGVNSYFRVRLGVGRPQNTKINVGDFVLQNFTEEEKIQLPDFVSTAGDAIESIIINGFEKTATKYNTNENKG